VLGRCSGFLLGLFRPQGSTVGFREAKIPKCWRISIFTIHTWESLLIPRGVTIFSGALSELEEFDDWTKEILGRRPATLKGEE